MQLHPSGTRIAGRYEVAGRPLVGGMGIVYLCFDHQEQRPVALKTFKPEFLPDRAARERFLEEGDTWVRLGKHPHIVRAYSVERIGDGREVYLVLELVAKEQGREDASLRSWLTPGQPLPAEQALLIALQIMRGMKHAVAVIPGLVHRDLKPGNVLVGADRLTNAPVTRVRVTDFGLVRGLRSEQLASADAEELTSSPGRLTRIGSVVGTPPYMAPEQWLGSAVDVRADIYAVGCILGEMLTGRMLVQGRTLDEVRRAHQDGQAMRVVRSVPEAMRELLIGCLAMEPDRRYRDWATLETVLAAAYGHIANQPPPEVEAADALSRAERIEAGWSYSEIGASYLDMGNAQAALNHLKAAHQTGKAQGVRQLEAAGLNYLGQVYQQLGDVRRAIGYHEQALAIHREICVVSAKGSSDWVFSRHNQGAALSNLGESYRQLGDAQQAIDCFEQSLVISREICATSTRDTRMWTAGRQGEGSSLGNLGIAYWQLGKARRAVEYYKQALGILQEIGDHRGESNVLSNLGGAHKDLGDMQRAISYYEQALALRRGIGYRHGEGADLSNLANVLTQLGDIPRAIDYHHQALIIFREIGARRIEGIVLANLGSAHEQLGDTRKAVGCYEEALAISREVGDRYLESMTLVNLGDACKDLADAQRAIKYFEQAVAICREINNVKATSVAVYNMALIYWEQGDLVQGLPLAREAARLFAQTGQNSSAQRARLLITLLEMQEG